MASLITDNFDRADNVVLGGPPAGWTWTEATGDIDIVSGWARSTSVLARARAEIDLDSPNMYAEADFRKSVPDGAVQNGNIAARLSLGTNAQLDMYVFQVQMHSANGTVIFFRTIDGSSTNIAQVNARPGVGFAADTTYRFRIEAVGTTLRGYIDEVLALTVDDSAPPVNFDPGVRSGFAIQDSTAAGHTEANDFEAGVMSSGGGGLMLPVWMHRRRR